jgi:hypothetical protein
MGNTEWDTKVMEPFDHFLHKSFRKYNNLVDCTMLIHCLAAQHVCDERALVVTSIQGTPDPENHQSDGDDSESEPERQPSKKRKADPAPANPNPSEYEIARAANSARNKELAERIDEKFREKYGELLPELDVGSAKPVRKKRGKKSDKEALRRSTRK